MATVRLDVPGPDVVHVIAEQTAFVESTTDHVVRKRQLPHRQDSLTSC